MGFEGLVIYGNLGYEVVIWAKDKANIYSPFHNKFICVSPIYHKVLFT